MIRRAAPAAIWIGMVATGAAAQTPLPVIASPAPIVVPPAAARLDDAGAYAARYGVSLAEAAARLRAQEESVAATDRIAAIHADRLAGIAIEHAPAYRIVVLLTGTVPVPDETVVAGGLDIPVVYRTGAGATRVRILAAIARWQAEIRAELAVPPGMAADPRTGTLVLAVNAADADLSGTAALEARFAALTGVAVRVIVPGRDANLAAAGGGRLVSDDPATRRRLSCTAGFVVTDGTRTALMTAAHCPDELVALDADGTRTPLTFVGQWGARFQDVQIEASDTALPPLFHAGDDRAALRPVTTWRNRTATRAGDFVCHQGERTGYSCAEVVWPDYAPPGDLCGGPCTPDWVVVAGPDCDHGDSGGPVFSGTTAFGILKGGSYHADGACNFYYYMSTDYLPDGWSLLHE